MCTAHLGSMDQTGTRIAWWGLSRDILDIFLKVLDATKKLLERMLTFRRERVYASLYFHMVSIHSMY